VGIVADVARIPVTEAEVEAAKLQIEVLERLGRPVDDRLRTLANAQSAQAEEPKAEEPTTPAAWGASVTEAVTVARKLMQSSRGKQDVLPSLRAHRNRIMERFSTSSAVDVFETRVLLEKLLLDASSRHILEKPLWDAAHLTANEDFRSSTPDTTTDPRSSR
jgi:hypothetical protein